MHRYLVPLTLALVTLAALLLPRDAHAAQSVALVWAGAVDGDRADMAAYVRHVTEDGYLAPLGIAAAYSGAVQAPAILGSSVADVDAFAAALPQGPLYLITLPTRHALDVGRPYHTRGARPYAVLTLPALPGYWQVSAAHELAESLAATEVADACEAERPVSDGHWLYPAYLVEGACRVWRG